MCVYYYLEHRTITNTMNRGKLYQISLSLIIFFISNIMLIGQVVLLDTVRTTDNFISSVRFSGDHVAWYEGDLAGNSNIIQFFDNTYDTLMINPPVYDHCDSRSQLFITDDWLLWSRGDTFDPNCRHTFTWEDGAGIQVDQFGALEINCQMEEQFLVNSTGNFNEFLLNLDTETLTPINLIDSNFNTYSTSNICSIAGDIFWFKAFTPAFVETIIRFDNATSATSVIYSSNNFLHFIETDYEDQLAFTESLPDNTFNIYYYNGSSVQFVANTGFNTVFTFNDGVVYRDESAGGPITYWRSDGTSTQLHPDATLVDQSRCFIAYAYLDTSNYPFFESELFITNGTTTESYLFDGLLRTENTFLKGNNFITMVTDLVPQNDVNRIIRGRHNISCPDLCPDDDAFAEDWNAADFLYTRTMESVAILPSTSVVDYEASQYILLSPTFEVGPTAEFHAQIVACP